MRARGRFESLTMPHLAAVYRLARQLGGPGAPQSKPYGSLTAEQVVGNWNPTPQDVAKKMIAKYGQPQEVTANRLVWREITESPYSARRERPPDESGTVRRTVVPSGRRQ